MIIILILTLILVITFIVLGGPTGHKTNTNDNDYNNNDSYTFPVQRLAVHLDHHKVDRQCDARLEMHCRSVVASKALSTSER